jgi:ubiquitin C-terminal hydrolase
MDLIPGVLSADPADLSSIVQGLSGRFVDAMQHDAEEVLRYLFERFTNSLNLKDEPQWTLLVPRKSKACIAE